MSKYLFAKYIILNVELGHENLLSRDMYLYLNMN